MALIDNDWGHHNQFLSLFGTGVQAFEFVELLNSTLDVEVARFFQIKFRSFKGYKLTQDSGLCAISDF